MSENSHHFHKQPRESFRPGIPRAKFRPLRPLFPSPSKPKPAAYCTQLLLAEHPEMPRTGPAREASRAEPAEKRRRPPGRGRTQRSEGADRGGKKGAISVGGCRGRRARGGPVAAKHRSALSAEVRAGRGGKMPPGRSALPSPPRQGHRAPGALHPSPRRGALMRRAAAAPYPDSDYFGRAPLLHAGRGRSAGSRAGKD